ncbi:MAG: helix-turn-helix transcriptional regulator [Nitrospirae bacterium]|nr:helix-turn-helix transcriptional regulator [Nitrospirota bacterium]
MEAGYSRQGGWFNDRPYSTGASSCVCSLSKVALFTAGLLVAQGTGAFADDLGRLQLHRNNELLSSGFIRSNAVKAVSARTPAEDMEQIRKVLSPAISDLAKAFNVSRQTIYNWLRGEQPTPEHLAKMSELAVAADMFAEAGIPVNGALLKRKVFNGRNIFEMIQDGGSARDAAQLLRQIVEQETSQRERLDARFANRKMSQSSADSDLMAENDVVQ